MQGWFWGDIFGFEKPKKKMQTLHTYRADSVNI